MPTKFYDKLSQDFTKLLELGDGYDVIINVGDDNGEEYDSKTNQMGSVDEDTNKKIKTSFKLHSAILRFRSEYFNKELTDLSPRNSENVIEIRKKHIKPEVFGVIVKYLYGGIIALENLEASMIFELMVAANEFFLDELVKYLESYLLETRADWLCLNFALIHNTSYQAENLIGLQNFCKEIVTKYPDLVLSSKDFTSLQEPVLISLLGRDDVQIEESKVWDYIIKWGIVQNSTTLTPNPEQWTDVDFYRLKTTLRHCLPLIRYSQLTEDDVFNKVRPYQRIIEPSIWMELVQKYPECDLIKSPFGSPPSSSLHSLRVSSTALISLRSESPQSPPPPPSFSEIITNEHAAQIATWIDRRLSTYTVTNNPYEFKLLLRGSEHGFKNKTFHDICDTHSRTVVILKVTGTNEILGGYNPLKWNNNVQDGKNSIKNTKSRQDNWSSTRDSFIFSLSEGKCILSRVSNPGYAFYYNARWGPNFGNHDLKMTGNYRNGKGTECKQVNYEKPIRKSNGPFSIDDYEVFEVCQRKE